MSQINSILNHFAFLAFCSILAFFLSSSRVRSVCVFVCVIARIQSKYCAHTHAYTISSGNGFELRMNVVCLLCPTRFASATMMTHTNPLSLSPLLWTTQVVFRVTPISIEIGSSSSTDCTTIVNYLIEYIDPGRLDQPSPFLFYVCVCLQNGCRYVPICIDGISLSHSLYTHVYVSHQLIYEYIS